MSKTIYTTVISQGGCALLSFTVGSRHTGAEPAYHPSAKHRVCICTSVSWDSYFFVKNSIAEVLKVGVWFWPHEPISGLCGRSYATAPTNAPKIQYMPNLDVPYSSTCSYPMPFGDGLGGLQLTSHRYFLNLSNTFFTGAGAWLAY